MELWFDPVVEAQKKRVICVVMDNAHFDLAVVRTPGLRFIFDRGTDWGQGTPPYSELRQVGFQVHRWA